MDSSFLPLSPATTTTPGAPQPESSHSAVSDPLQPSHRRAGLSLRANNQQQPNAPDLDAALAQLAIASPIQGVLATMVEPPISDDDERYSSGYSSEDVDPSELGYTPISLRSALTAYDYHSHSGGAPVLWVPVSGEEGPVAGELEKAQENAVGTE